jgi:hypothetical protein
MKSRVATLRCSCEPLEEIEGRTTGSLCMAQFDKIPRLLDVEGSLVVQPSSHSHTIELRDNMETSRMMRPSSCEEDVLYRGKFISIS